MDCCKRRRLFDPGQDFDPLEQLPTTGTCIQEGEASWESRGRTGVRSWGSKPLLRVLVEAETHAEVEPRGDPIREAIERMLQNCFASSDRHTNQPRIG